jgi:hypothetical protein
MERRDRSLGDKSLEDLLSAGREAFSKGDRESAHELWRMAAVANPYDERVWAALMEVLTRDDDREVCLENIIAINPLNPDARRQLRQIKRNQRLQGESASPDELDSTSRREIRAARRAERLKAEAEAADEPFMSPERLSKSGVRRIAPVEELLDEVEKTSKRHSLGRSVLRGIGFGLIAVLLGVIASIVVYGGVLPR